MKGREAGVIECRRATADVEIIAVNEEIGVSSLVLVEAAAREIYADYPEMLEALGFDDHGRLGTTLDAPQSRLAVAGRFVGAVADVR